MWSKSKKMGDFGGKPSAGSGLKNTKDQTKTSKKGKTMGSYAAKKSGFAGGIIV